jgi:hypothetical protein
MQHGLFERMPTAGDHPERSGADVQRIAMLDAMIRRGHTRRLPQILMAATKDGFRHLRGKPMASIEGSVHV